MLKTSLRDKIGQMLLIGFDGLQVTADSFIVKEMYDFGIGGVILFDYDFKSKNFEKNIANKQQLCKLNCDLQYFNTLASQQKGRNYLPLLVSVDYEGGSVNRLKSNYGFPETIPASLVAKLGDEKANEVTTVMAETLSELGFNLNFAPVLDVAVNLDNPILAKLGRCFSSDPKEVAHFGRIYTEAFLKNNIGPVFKHFPGHGSSNDDSHLGMVDVTDTWQPEELLPYELLFKAFDSSKTMIMTAHIVNRQLEPSGLAATLSYKILTKLLRHKLKFEGVVISDDMQMKAISDHYGLEQSLVLAINAGVDMFIFGNQLSLEAADCGKILNIIEDNVAKGVIKLERINEAYARILAFKSFYGTTML